jgi:hypothetical protein
MHRDSSLTPEVWTQLLADELTPAYPGGIPDGFEAHATWTLRQVQTANWSPFEARWSLREVARLYRRLDNLWAMLNQVHDPDRDGKGGWQNSREYAEQRSRRGRDAERDDCRRRVVDFPADASECGRYARCADCDKRPGWRGGVVDVVALAEVVAQKAGG